MASNPININSQMQTFADKAVVAAREKFSVDLDFSQHSLKQLDLLLQEAHLIYKQISKSEDPQHFSIESTVRVWGSYLGEVIRRSLGGDWIAYQKNVYLQLGSQRLDPLQQVRSRIMEGPQFSPHLFFKKLIQDLHKAEFEHAISLESNVKLVLPAEEKKVVKKKPVFVIGMVILGALILGGICLVVAYLLVPSSVWMNLIPNL